MEIDKLCLIYRYVQDHKEINWSEYLILRQIRIVEDIYGFCTIGDIEEAKITTRPAVYNYVKSLVSKGFVARENKGSMYDRNHFFLCLRSKVLLGKAERLT